jgi:serine protease Do
VLTSLNGQAIVNSRGLPRLIAEAEVGKSVRFALWRDGASREVSVVLGQLEEAEKNGLSGPAKPDPKKAKEKGTAGSAIEGLGVTVAPLTEELRKTHGVGRTVNGLVITAIDAKGAAAGKGLQVGDVIIEAGQQPVAKVDDLAGAVRAAREKTRASLLLLLARKDDRRYEALKLGQ